MLERLHKVLARAGVAALRPAEDLIMAGRVTVNGRVVRELGTRVDAETDVIAVDGQLVDIREPNDPHRYLLVNKPVGVISTAQDTHGRPTVVGLVPSDVRLFPVGRLDADSEGLILLTDDGDLAYRLTHPRFEVEKEYRVLLDRAPTTEDLRRWREGIELDGEMTMPAWVEVLERTPEGAWIRVVMREGRKRQIREVARLLNYHVQRLIRVREGPLTLGNLAPSEWRELTSTEVQTLRAHTQHIPSRADDQQREQYMTDRDRPEGRRLRIIRGPRRTSTGLARDDQPAEFENRRPDVGEQSLGKFESEGQQDEERSNRSGNQRAVERGRDDRQPRAFSEQRPAPGQRRDVRQRPNSHAEQARRQPRTIDGRSDESGRRNRDAGRSNSYGRRERSYEPRRDFGTRGPSRPGDTQRRYDDRNSSRQFDNRPNRAPDNRHENDNRRNDRGPRSFNDRPGGSGPQRDRGPRDYSDRRDDRGPQGDRGPRSFNDRPSGSGPQRDRGPRSFNDRPGGSGPQRDRGPRSFNDRPGGSGPQRDRAPRDYSDRRDDRGPRDYGDRRDRPYGQQSRDAGPRNSGSFERDDRRDRPSRPGAPRGRAGYDRSENSGERRSANSSGNFDRPRRTPGNDQYSSESRRTPGNDRYSGGAGRASGNDRDFGGARRSPGGPRGNERSDQGGRSTTGSGGRGRPSSMSRGRPSTGRPGPTGRRSEPGDSNRSGPPASRNPRRQDDDES